MAVVRKGSLNARQRARLAVQVDQEKIKRQVDLFTEALTAVDARDQAEIRLGQALNELRGMGLSRADIADRSGLTSREVTVAMRAATEAETLETSDENGAGEGDEQAAFDAGVDASEDVQISYSMGDNQDVTGDTENDATSVRSSDPVPAH